MKKILCGSAAAIAMIGLATPAAAQTNERHYAGVSGPYGVAVTNPQNIPGSFLGVDLGDAATAFLDALVTPPGIHIGTRYTALADAPDDTVEAQPVVTVAFSLSGEVNADCSFYAGNTGGATNIDFGTIGVRTGDNENVNAAFEMNGAATAEIETLTAGCNTNNIVKIEKDNVDGLVNLGAGAYDTNEFQANIPYEVTATWTGVDQGPAAEGEVKSFTVDTQSSGGSLPQGAWRSAMQIDITAPVAELGLVAGEYTGQTTVTLTAS